ncbi:MAG: FMN-binding glutamate synthase family protein [Bacillota bacterium]
MTKNNDWLRKLLFSTPLGILGALGTIWLGRRAIKKVSNSFIQRLMVDSYSENLWEFVSASRKVGLQTIVETNLRAQKGKMINRPLGSPKTFPNLDGIMFNCAQLHRLPTDEGTDIDTRVVIGPSAKKPLKIEMPIIISGMAYGLALSAKAKIALAKGSTMAGTATNTGEGAFLPAERKAAAKLILQYNRGKWSKSEKILKQADMIEIHLGQGARAGVGHKIEDKQINWKIKRMLGLRWGERAIIHANFPGIKEPNYLYHLVKYLREVTEGVPIGVKLAASKYIEEDLEIALEAGIDVIALDGSEAATKGTAPVLQDDFGLPTLFALTRATNYFQKHGLKDKVSLIMAGGLATPGNFLKAIALGADAVYIGSIALFAMSHTQVLKSIPWEPPTGVVFYKGKFQHKLNVNKGAKNLANFLEACNEEIKEAVRALGKTSIHQVDKSDLFALDPFTAEVADIPLGFKEINFYLDKQWSIIH